MAEDRINIYGVLKQDQLSFGEFKRLLDLLDQQEILEAPDLVKWDSETQMAPISKYGDPKVLEVYQDPGITLNRDGKIMVLLSKNDRNHEYHFSIHLATRSRITQDQLEALIREILALKQQYYSLRCSLFYRSQGLKDVHFGYDFLEIAWYSLFSPEYLQFLEQRGRDLSLIRSNPHAQVTETPQGLVQKIGDSPFHILTPEGEKRFLDSGNYLLGR